MRTFDRLQKWLRTYREFAPICRELEAQLTPEELESLDEDLRETVAEVRAGSAKARFAEYCTGVVVLDVRNTVVGTLFEPGLSAETLSRRQNAVRSKGIRLTPPVLPLWVEGNDWALLVEEVLVEEVEEADSTNVDATSDVRTIGVRSLVRREEVWQTISGWVDISRSTGEFIKSGPNGLEPPVGEVEGLLFALRCDCLLLALGLLHCRNVKLEERSAPRHERRRAAREGEPPPTKYYVLEIDGVLRKTIAESRARGEPAMQALHLCRGHFKTYTPERPLLGRSSGTFWWDPHVRGTKEAGVVVKDYALKIA